MKTNLAISANTTISVLKIVMFLKLTNLIKNIKHNKKLNCLKKTTLR